MKLHELKPVKSKQRTRVGRGISGKGGKTAGRGTKGQKARSGYSHRSGFEGGQNPLTQRIPKLRGFRSVRPRPQIIHTDQLNRFKSGERIDKDILLKAGLIRYKKQSVRLVLRGKLNKPLTLIVDGASKAAADALKKAGGKIEIADSNQKQASQKAPA